MQFFSDEYLMHYGVKGMKWKKHRMQTDTGTGERVDNMQKAMDEHRSRLDASNPSYRWYRSAALETGDHREYQKRENRELPNNYGKIESRNVEMRKKLRAQQARKENLSLKSKRADSGSNPRFTKSGKKAIKRKTKPSSATLKRFRAKYGG